MASRRLLGTTPLAALALVDAAALAEATSLRFRAFRPSQVFGIDTKADLHGASFARLGEMVLVDSMLLCVTIAISSLIVFFLWAAVAQFCHWGHFRACTQKVHRANQAFGSRRGGDLPICPCCVEPVAASPSPSRVVFLCGHQFHTRCCNAWSSGAAGVGAGCCPVCEDDAARPIAGGPTEPDSPASSKAAQRDEEGAATDGVDDEAQVFVLNSLHRQFPDIITEACVQRWSSCHTQLWVSELSCPRQKCFLHNKP